MNLKPSNCRGSFLHKFITLAGTNDGVLERCVFCGKKHVIKLVNGAPHTVDYARHHVREFLVPQHRLFYKHYPKHA